MFRVRSRHLILFDAFAVVFAYVVAFMIRFDAGYFGDQLRQYGLVVVPALIATIVALERFGLYRRVWRYASTAEFAGLVAALTVGSVVMVLTVLLSYAPGIGGFARGFPRGVIAIHWLVAIGLIGGVRLILRIASEYGADRRKGRANGADTIGIPTLIVGAGDAGALVAREMQSNPALGLRPIGFVDDDKRKRGLLIRGLPVLGSTDEIGEVAQAHGVREIIIAMPTAGGRTVRRVAEAGRAIGIPSKTVPGLYEIISGNASIQQFRDVSISDLLRREQVRLPTDGPRSLIEGRVVAITGAGGSIGSELCRQIAGFHPSRLVIIGHGEFSLLGIQTQLRHHWPGIPVSAAVLDVKDAPAVDRAFWRHRPEIVFHAAAHKHVVFMEENPHEAVAANVFGTLNVARAAARAGATKFLLISTDKAVRPPNVYGATKRLAEMVVQAEALRHEHIVFSTVRFGNVLGSRGSVVPLLQEQIAQGGPLRVTDPAATRFFMTIPEAVQLVLQAASIADTGQLFVLDMGEPVVIGDLVRDLVHLSGLRLGRDIDIEIIGLRQGEKLHEELVDSDEHVTATPIPKVRRVEREAIELPALERDLGRLAAALGSDVSDDELRGVLQSAVPDAHLSGAKSWTAVNRSEAATG